MKAAIVNSENIVTNVIVWQDSDVWNGTETLVVLEDDHHVSVGATHNGGTSFTIPVSVYEDIRTYKEKRAMSYPPITDQLDALFHAGVFPAEMAAQIQAIKDMYPKE